MEIDVVAALAGDAPTAPTADNRPDVEARPVLSSLQKTAIGTRGPTGAVSVTRREPARCLLYGPFWRLEQGRYRLNFRCEVAAPRGSSAPVLGIEIIALNRLQLAWRDFTAAELAGGAGFIDFAVPALLSLEAGDLTRFEFRFVHLGRADLTISAVDLQPVMEAAASRGSQWRLLGRLQRWLCGRYRGAAFTVRRFEPAGCVLRGGRPYIQLAEGRYRATLRCRSGAPRQPGQPVIGIQAVGLRGRYPWHWRQDFMLESPAHDRQMLVWADFTAEELADGEAVFEIDVPLAFSVETGDAPWLEFKLFHFGNADLEIAALDLERCGEVDPDDPAPLRWRLLGRAGRQVAADGAIALRRNDRPGSLISGPGAAFEAPAGRYRLRLTGRLDREVPDETPLLAARIALVPRRRIAPAEPDIIARHEFTAAELRDGVASMDFALASDSAARGARLKLELSHFGNADLTLRDVEILKLVAPPGDVARPGGAVLTRRRNVLVIGNCQAETVAEAFRRAAPLRRRFDANYQFVGLQKGLREAGRRLLETADLLLVQDIKDWESYPLREFIPDGVEIIEFPFLRFASLWPFDGYGGVNDVEAYQREWPDLTFIYLDGLLGRLRREIPDKEARFRAYRDLDAPGIVNYVRLHDFERRYLQSLDRKFGCNIGQFILDNFRQRQIFYAINHPNTEVFTVLLEWLMQRLGIEERFTEPLEHIDVVRRVQVPVHPKVAEALGVSWADENTRYTYEGRQIVWEDWVRAYIDHYG